MKRLFAAILLCLIFLPNYNLLAQSSPIVLVTYYSESGNTKAMADAVVKGVQQVEGVRFVLKPIGEVNQDEILAADAIILGSPVYNANMAPAVQSFINFWPFEGRPLKNKIGAVFVTGGGISIGEEAVMFAMIRAMMIHGMVIIGGDELEAAFGASAITGEAPFDLEEKPAAQFLTKAEGLGKRVSEYILKLHTINK